MNTIDALKRLERAGDENSKATAKLHEAAAAVALAIINAAPAGVALPRGYNVRKVKSNVGSEYFLTVNGCWIDGIGKYLHGDFHAEIPAQTRAGSLRFANDIATGLLDEIAEFLEKRAAEAAGATETLKTALPQAEAL